MLEADGEPQQALGDAALRLHARPALDQRLDAAEAGRAAREPHVVLAAPGSRPVGELECEDAAGAARHLAQCELVVGMAGEPGVVHRVHRGMLRKPPCELGCGRHLAGEAHVQRPQAAQEQPRGVGSEHAADRAARQHQSLAQLRIARRDDAGEHVGVAGEVLRRALPGEVGAEVERALEQRRRERAVAAQQRAARVRGARRPTSMSVRVSSGLEGVSMSASAAPSQARRKSPASRAS